MPAASSLYQPAKAYVARAFALLSSKYPVAPPEPLVGVRDWVPHSADTFILRDREIPYWHRGIVSGNALHSLDEYRSLVEALRADPVASPHLGTIVTSAPGGGR